MDRTMLAYQIKHPKRPAGFTLAELLAGITILIVLAAILINAYQTYIVREQVRDGVRLANSLKSPITQHFETHGAVPVSRTALGLEKDATKTSNNYVKSIDVNNGRLDITFGNQANATIADAILYIVPYQTPENSIVWQCGDADKPSDAEGRDLQLAGRLGAKTPVYAQSTVPARYRPDYCR